MRRSNVRTLLVALVAHVWTLTPKASPSAMNETTRFTKRFLLSVTVLVLCAGLCAAQDVGDAESSAVAGHWSAPVGGLQARLIVASSEIRLGTLLVSVRLVLRDVRGEVGWLSVPWTKAELKWYVEDAAGNHVQRTVALQWTGPMASPDDLRLPAGATLSFELTTGRAVAGQAAILDLGPLETFLIPRDGDYFLSGSMTVWAPVGPTAAGNWYGSIVFPAVRIPARSDLRANSTSASAIDEVGAKMLDRRSWRASDDALRALSLINDERVVPWYLEALRDEDSPLVPRALDGLSRFDSDAALDGIRSMMTSEDGNVRHAAAIALRLSPHAGAKTLLWTMIDDPRQALRMVVVSAAGETASPEANAVLEHALNDANETVRATARSLLGGEAVRR